MRSPRLLLLVLALALTCSVANLHAQEGTDWLTQALVARSVTEAEFARSEVFTWTTRAQADQLARDHRLLWAGAADGATRGPYQRALDGLAESADANDQALAHLLTNDPRLAARRYTWTTPYGTALPRGTRSYGPVLVRIELRSDAWHLRFAPSEAPAFRVIDARGNAVPVSEVLASPTRIATVLHVRHDDAEGGYREILVHGGVARWSMGTPAITARIDEDIRVLEALRRTAPDQDRRLFAPMWSAPITRQVQRFAATIPFDTSRHRMTREALAGLIRVLRARRNQRIAPFISE